MQVQFQVEIQQNKPEFHTGLGLIWISRKIGKMVPEGQIVGDKEYVELFAHLQWCFRLPSQNLDSQLLHFVAQ